MIIVFECLLGTLWLLLKYVLGICIVGFLGVLIYADHRCNSVQQSWLTKMSCEVPPDAGAPGKFGRTKLKPGDQIWHYSSPPETRERMCGRSGIALVRKGRIIKTELMMMN